MNWSKVEEAFETAVVPFPMKSDSAQYEHVSKKHFAFPGAVLLVGQDREVLYHKAFGCRSLQPAISSMEKDTVFDIASLTKVLVTTTLMMQLVDRGQVDVDSGLSRIFQTFSTLGKERMKVRHLLAHCSGYPATLPFYKQIIKADRGERTGIMASRGALEMVYNEIFRTRLEHAPGTATMYSDLGFMLLGAAVEMLSGGAHLDRVAKRDILLPLGLQSTGYIDLSQIRRRGLEQVSDVIAPTAYCPWRNRILCGEVHDDNAWAMGGIAGHSGVFSTALDLHTFTSEMIRCWHGQGTLVSQQVVRRFWTIDGTVPASSWALGWDTPSKVGSSAGKYFSPHSVGHLGFTGCSIWVDPERNLDVILLSNRIHPRTDNNGIREFRPLIHDLVMEVLGYDG